MTGSDIAFEAAATLYRQTRIDKAEAACREILERSPGDARTLHLLGVICGGRDIQEGIRLIRQAIAAKPDYAEAHFNLAAMLAAAGQPGEAATHYAEVARLRSDDLVAHIRHAALLTAAGETGLAIEQYQNVLRRWTDSVPALLGLGALYLTRGQIARSIELHRRAVRLAPESADVAACLGRALKRGGFRAEAIAEYRRALALAPEQFDALNFLAVALLEEGALAEAETVISRACVREPGSAAAHFNASVIAQATGDLATARTSLGQALDLDPDNLFYRRAALATTLYDPDLGEAARAEVHRAFGARAAVRTATLPRPQNPADPARRLRVGLLSSDFRDHPVARNLEPILAHYDRSAFELWLYGEVSAPDETTRRLVNLADHWSPIIGLSDRQVADQVRADGIDILFFLAGRFDGNRPEIAAWRAAPVQVSLHDPGTGGMPGIDYLIADRNLAPRRGGEWFAERVTALPTFFLHPPIPSAPPVGPLPMSWGDGVTFGSFNNPAKANDRVLALWAQLLREVQRSRLVLKYRGYFAEAPVRRRVERAAVAAGVDPERFVLLGQREDHDTHLARYNEIDIALDPFPFSGSTTTFEALWMGVPVVTWPGTNMASRWSAAMLRALKLDAWIARSAESYIGIAAELAGDAGRLAEIRSGLRRRVAQSALCDGVRRTRQMERLMKAHWRRWCAEQGSPNNLP